MISDCGLWIADYGLNPENSLKSEIVNPKYLKVKNYKVV